jgi:hypothetical protein
MHSGTQVRGLPARHARRLRLRAQAATIAALAVAGAGGVSLVVDAAVPLVLSAAGVIIGASAAQPARRRWRQAAVGIRSEDRVARILARSGAAVVIHGANLATPGRERGDVDHVVLGPVAATIETKTGRGVVRARGERVHVGRRLLPGRPLHQASVHARQLTRRIGVPATAVLCVVDMVGAPFNAGDVIVCSAADLAGVLGRLPRTIDPASASALAATIPLAD